MAEVIAVVGIVASVAQLADFGFKLSVKLFTFSKAVASADTSIKDISNDVSLTSTVLKELCQVLQADESHVVSENAVEATKRTVKECLSIFEQLDYALDRSLGNLGMLGNKGKAKRGKVALEKLIWPFKQNKMELMRSNLDRLKASLTLMLQVLSYARDISSRQPILLSPIRKHLIESLARSEQETKRRYLALQMAIEGDNAKQGLNAFINTSVHISEAKGMEIMSQPPETPTAPVVKSRTVVGELLLCFQLLNDVLGHHLAVSKISELSSLGYEQLRLTLEKIHVKEINRLKEEFGDASIHIKAEAAKNLENRLKELARAGYLKEPKHEENPPKEKQNTTETPIPRLPAQEQKVPNTTRKTSIGPPVTNSLNGTAIPAGRNTPRSGVLALPESKEAQAPLRNEKIVGRKEERTLVKIAKIPNVVHGDDPQKEAETKARPSIEVRSTITHHSTKQRHTLERPGIATIDPGNRRKVAKTLTAISHFLGTAKRKQIDESQFKQGKALDFPEIPGEEHRMLPQTSTQYNQVHADDGGVTPRAGTPPMKQLASELQNMPPSSSAKTAQGRLARRRDTLEVPSPVHHRNKVEDENPPAIVVSAEPEMPSPANSQSRDHGVRRGKPSIPRVTGNPLFSGNAGTGHLPSTTSFDDPDDEGEASTGLEAVKIDEEQEESGDSDVEGEESSVVEDLLSQWTTLSPSTY